MSALRRISLLCAVIATIGAGAARQAGAICYRTTSVNGYVGNSLSFQQSYPVATRTWSLSTVFHGEAYTSTGAIDFDCKVRSTTEIWDIFPGAFPTVFASAYGIVHGVRTSTPLRTGTCYTAYQTLQVFDWLGAELALAIGSSGQACVPEPVDKPEIPDENCPIVLDLDGDGYHLGDLDHAVDFDIDADGVRERLTWTAGGTRDALLCRDVDRNGSIDDGRELFGYATRLADGSNAVVGYRALAEMDSPTAGGNGDGVVDARDPAYAELCVWVDANHDGVSQTGEVAPLTSTQFVGLRYAYQTTRRRDTSGNLFRYRSSAWVRTPGGGVRLEPTYDVIFASPQ